MSRSLRLLVVLAVLAFAETRSPSCRAQCANCGYSTFPTYPSAGGLYWSGYGNPYPAWYGYYYSGYYYPFAYGWYANPYSWPYVWAGWYSGPYLYPFRPYASWFHPVIYYPGAYMFPTPIGYPLVAAPAAEESKKEKKPAEKIAANPASLRKTELLKEKSRGDAPSLYLLGLEEYRDGRYAKAIPYLEAATVLDDGDPRYWYFLALSRWMAGETEAGDDAAKYGAAVQVAQQFDRSIVARSLESVQGRLRYRLEEALLSTDRAKAASFLAAKRPTGEITASAR